MLGGREGYNKFIMNMSTSRTIVAQLFTLPRSTNHFPEVGIGPMFNPVVDTDFEATFEDELTGFAVS